MASDQFGGRTGAAGPTAEPSGAPAPIPDQTEPLTVRPSGGRRTVRPTLRRAGPHAERTGAQPDAAELTAGLPLRMLI